MVQPWDRARGARRCGAREGRPLRRNGRARPFLVRWDPDSDPSRGASLEGGSIALNEGETEGG